MATTLYGYGNTITSNGDYVLGADSLLGIGGGSVTASGQNVTNASLSFGQSLIGLANPYIVTSKNGANLTIDTTSSVIGALTGTRYTADGGTINITGNNAISALSGGDYFIRNGGTINLGTINGDSNSISALSGTNIQFQTGGGTLVVTPGSNVSILTFNSVTGFENTGATIKIPGAGKVTNATYDGTDTNITTDSGITLKIRGNFTAANNNLYQVTDGNNLYISSTPTNSTSTEGNLVCFLAGSMILTLRGPVAIEVIQVGDQVVTFDWKNNENVIRTVKWVGKAHHTVLSNVYDDAAGYPVRIKKDAFADKVPYKDMLITPEHCLFIEGGFIPVRMLVNGGSIYYDHSIRSYDYYHLELEEHSVITVDGVLSESYLNTANHECFEQSGNVISLKIGTKTWESDAAAPLMTFRDKVESIYHRIKERADGLGCARQRNDRIMTHDPELCLVMEQGKVIYPHSRSKKDQYLFVLPSGIEQIYIHSLSSRPSDVIGPFLDDRRELGVLVGNIILFDQKKVSSICFHLEEDELYGWHVLENKKCRWTNGHALLPVGKEQQEGNVRMLMMELLAAGPYFQKQDVALQNRIIS